MSRYAIADTGSNTVVLIVYEVNEKEIRQLKYLSTPIHLINYVKDGRISQEGIEKAARVLTNYAGICDEMGIVHRFADITEPGRVENRDELKDALAASGFEVFPLSGEEEALFDFAGAKLSCPDVHEGIAFDVGGGSTELISFQNDEALETVSFPLGCVRLSHLPLETEECRAEIMKARKACPSLRVSAKTIIGIGGTVRAMGLVFEKISGDRRHIEVNVLKEVYERLKSGDEILTQLVRNTVDPARVPVFLPGIRMILEICEVFETEDIMISDTGIREGFLLERIRNL